MAKALRINIRNPRELRLLTDLKNGSVDFDWFFPEDQMLLYTSAVDISPWVEEEQIKAFEEKYISVPETPVESRAKKLVNNLLIGLNRRLEEN